MNASEERFIDLLLEEVVGGVRPPDVTARVVALARQVERPTRIARAAGITIFLVAAVTIGIVGWSTLRRGTSAGAGAAAERERKLDELLAKIATPAASFDESDPAYFDKLKGLDEAVDALDRELATTPAERARLRPRLVELSRSGHDDDVRHRAIALLLPDDSLEAKRAIGAALAESSALFLPDDLLAAAEADVPEAIAPLREFVLEEPPNSSRAPAALHLARRGDRDVGRVLARLLDPDMADAVSTDERLIAALGLAELADPEPLRGEKAALRALIEEMLTRSEIAAARDQLLRAEYLLTPAPDGSARALSNLWGRLAEYTEAHVAELPDAAAIRARIVRLTQ